MQKIKPAAVFFNNPRNYGRVNQLSDGKTRIKMDAIKVLNLLGKIGYRVISASAVGSDGYAWTLEKKNFDMVQVDGVANEF